MPIKHHAETVEGHDIHESAVIAELAKIIAQGMRRIAIAVNLLQDRQSEPSSQSPTGDDNQ